MFRSLVLLLLALPLAAAPVPKAEKVKPEDVTDAHVELATVPAIQREVKLSADQRATLTDGLDAITELGWPGRWRNHGLKAAPTAEQLRKDKREVVASVLSKAQFTRLMQCEVQALGPQAIATKRVQDALGLTDAQKKAVTKTLVEPLIEPPLLDLPKPAVEDDKPAPNQRWLSGRDRNFLALIETFAPEQAKTWADLNGDEVKFDLAWFSEAHRDLFTEINNLKQTATAEANK
jgi:hypothetical protein